MAGHVFRQQKQHNIGSLRMTGKDKRAAVVVMIDVVIKRGNHIPCRILPEYLPTLVFRQNQGLHGVGLAVIGCVNISCRLKSSGLRF